MVNHGVELTPMGKFVLSNLNKKDKGYTTFNYFLYICIMTKNQIKYLKITQGLFNKGLITKKQWKKERKFVREIIKNKKVN